MDRLKELFSKEMLILYKKISTQIRYKSQNLLKYINEYGGYQAALKYIYTPSYTHDFSALWEAGRLDLSIEVLLLQDKYQEIVSSEIRKFCAKRLEEYNYKPKEIPKEIQKEQPLRFADVIEEGSENMPTKSNSFNDVYYTELVNISKAQWKNLFLNDKIFTLKNKELILKMYNLGKTRITYESLGETKYAYKEILTMLAKKIKPHVKIEVPTSDKGEALWWNILLLGNFKDNQHFDLVLNPNLYAAISAIVGFETSDEPDNRAASIDRAADRLARDDSRDYDRAAAIDRAADRLARDDSRDHDRSAAINRTYQNAITEKISHGFTDDEITPITENTLDKNLSKVNTLSQLKNNTRLLSQAEKNTVISHKHEIGSIGHIDNNLDSNNIPSLSLVRGKKDISKEKSINSPKKGFLNDDLNDDEKLDAFVEDFFADDNENDVEFEEEPSLEELAQIERMLSGSFDTPASSALQKMQRKPFEIKSPTKANDLELKKEEEAKAKWNILKQECLEYYGASCEICGMDYGYTYGDKFEHLMDVYNTKSKEKNWDNLNVDPEKDLIPVCHNCSAIIHAKTPHYNVEEVKKFIQNK